MAAVQTFRNSAGTSLFDVDDSGNVTAAGAVSGASLSSAEVTGTLVTATIFALTAAAPQSIDMADGAVELVYGITAGAGQVAVTSSRLNVDPNSGGASEDLTIDTTALGLILAIANVGGESIVIKSNGGSTLGTIAAGGTALVMLGVVNLGA